MKDLYWRAQSEIATCCIIILYHANIKIKSLHVLIDPMWMLFNCCDGVEPQSCSLTHYIHTPTPFPHSGMKERKNSNSRKTFGLRQSLTGTAKAVHASKADEGIHWLLWQEGVQPPPGKQAHVRPNGYMGKQTP